MRKYYLFFYLALLPEISSAQSKIRFCYDAAGNRVIREIVMPVSKAKAKQWAPLKYNQNFSDILSGRTVKIFPNPTDGALKIYFSSLKNADRCTIGIWSSQGAHVLSESVEKESIDIDLSSNPPGIYILRITLNDKSSTWKIIKK